MEVEARNLILDKVIYETERDALIEFRIAHPPLFLCSQCSECFLTPQDCTLHQADQATHLQKEKDLQEISRKFLPVENVLLGPYGRKLIAHRLLFSVELNGLQSRLEVVKPQPYRPNICDKEGKRAEQLRHGMLVLGGDPRAGIRPLYDQHHLNKQARSTWGQEQNQQLSLQDTMTYLQNHHDHPLDVVFTTVVSQHVEVSFSWRGFIRYGISLLGEFNGWKPMAIYPDETGVYTHKVPLSPGRYQYRYLADGVETIDPTASSMKSSDGVLNNVILVLNPYQRERRVKELLPSHLNIRNSYLYADGAWALADSIQQSNSHLVSFDVSHNHLSDEGMMAIAHACTHLPNLHTLLLNNNSFTFDGVRYLTAVYQIPSSSSPSTLALAHLELCNNRIGNDGAELLGQLLTHHPSLKEVYLDCNFISDDGAIALGHALEANNTLMKLSLAGNQIRSVGIERFCSSLRLNGSLRELNLSQNPLGPEGGKHVGHLLIFNNTLRTLHLSFIQLILNKQQQGLLSLTEGIKRNKGLFSLTLKGNSLDNDHALEIAFGLSNNHTLRSMDLDDNPITSQWFESNSFLKTKLLAKMPTIQTSLERNQRLLEDPILMKRFVPRDEEMDSEHEGQWNRRRIWRVGKRKGGGHAASEGEGSVGAPSESVGAPSQTTGGGGGKKGDDGKKKRSGATVEEEEKRMKAEETYIAENLYKYAMTLTVFLNSPDGKITIKYLSRVIEKYFHQLALPADEREAVTRTGAAAAAAASSSPRIETSVVHIGIMTEFLLLCQEEVREKERQRSAQLQLQIQQQQSQSSSALITEQKEGKKELGKRSKSKRKSTPQIISSTSGLATAVMSPRELKRQESAALPNQFRTPEEEALLTTVVPPAVEEELQQTVSVDALDLFCQKLHITLVESDREEMIQNCQAQRPSTPSTSHVRPSTPSGRHHDPTPPTTPTGFGGRGGGTPPEAISIQRFSRYLLAHLSTFFPQTRFRSLLHSFFQFSPLSLASQLLYHHHINEKRLFYRQQYRHDPTKVPLHYCQVCGKRFVSQRNYKRHEEKSKKEHQKLFQMEAIWLSEDALINMAKRKQVGVQFPAYYLLEDTRFMPKYFTPQVFDEIGEEGRPIGVIEPDLTYRVNDLLGVWIQIKYDRGVGWTRYRVGALTVMAPCMSHVKGFWDNIENYAKPVFFVVRGSEQLGSSCSSVSLSVCLSLSLSLKVSDVLPDGVQIKVRQKPDMEAVSALPPLPVSLLILSLSDHLRHPGEGYGGPM
jgi:Ran GTPase-activating protein (RanGAP) involved in mRNA processing and transport